MKLYWLRPIACLLIFGLPFSYGYSNPHTKNELEILGQSISFLKENYSCARTIISGPSKRKLICADSDKKLFSHAVKNRLVSIEILESTSHMSVSDIPIKLPSSCNENLHSNLKTVYNCDDQKTVILDLNLDKAELKRHYCFTPFCYSKTN